MSWTNDLRRHNSVVRSMREQGRAWLASFMDEQKTPPDSAVLEIRCGDWGVSSITHNGVFSSVEHMQLRAGDAVRRLRYVEVHDESQLGLHCDYVIQSREALRQSAQLVFVGIGYGGLEHLAVMFERIAESFQFRTP